MTAHRHERCCHATGGECAKPAAWAITVHDTPDPFDLTFSCDDHLHLMLAPAVEGGDPWFEVLPYQRWLTANHTQAEIDAMQPA